MVRMPGAQEALTMYGLVLMMCGALAYQAAGGKREARSALIVGNAAALIAFLTAGGVGQPGLKRGDKGFRLMMICVHWALVFPLAMAAVLVWRLSKAAAVPSKQYIVPYLAVMIAASFATVGIVAVNRPKKNPAAVRAARAVGKAEKAAKGKAQ